MRILIALILFSSVAYGQQSIRHAIDPKAKILADSAYKLARTKLGDPASLKSAIRLLKQATEIDSSYISGFRNTLSYQMILKDYEGALMTAKRMADLWPQNPSIITSLGITYELTNDTITSKPYFQKAVTLYDNILDTLSGQTAILLAKSSRALNLLFLNHYQEGQAIISELILNNKNSLEAEVLYLYLNKTGHEIILMLANGEDRQSVTPVSQ